ncbi:MAG: hypothetical protein A2854_03780 [Parcubacteria group bacterium RIFCSPHIGHO2_01_FULL_56_18]|nr:MAG: hypothetical protein A2854_03780 [Parcubacteria group bacterium RIFCSPHIGHO2_01_FULL_56_18]
MAILQNKVVMLVLGSLLAAVAAWYLFLRDTTPAPLLTTEDLTTSNVADKDVVETLLQLRAITLSGTIFTDPAFVSLRDNGTQIVPEPVGRPNPFLPLGGSSATSTSAASSSPASGQQKPAGR